MKLPELKSKFKNRYAIRIIAGVLVVTLVATGSSVYSVNAAKAGSAATENVEETEVSEEAEDTEDAESFSFTCRIYNTAPPTSAQIPPQVLLSAMLYVTLRYHKTEASRALKSRFSGPQQAWNLFQVLLPPASH